MEKIIGLDLGTNSIGWAIVHRYNDLSYTLLDKGVNIFQDGVAHDKSGEKPAVQERTAARASRRHYFRRRLRKIQLLKILVEQRMCPYISNEDLEIWKLHKKYPVNDDFMAWQKTDDAIDKNPYHDRYRCLTEVLDMDNQTDRYSLGRALYHIAQRRGFLSNRKESTKESDGTVKSGIDALGRDMKNAGCEYLGEFFYKIYGTGQKIRTRYTSRTDHYKKEFDAICAKQALDDKLKERFEKALAHNTCWYGKFVVMPDGKIAPCIFERTMILGDLTKQTIQDVLKSDQLNYAWNYDFSKVNYCKDCEFRFACRDCRPLGLSTHNCIAEKNPRCLYNPYTGRWGE